VSRDIFYTLDADGLPVPEPDPLAWGDWYEKADRHVADDRLGPACVSTVFLGVDHDFSGEGPPVLYETLVFWEGHPLDETMRRYASRAGALRGHAAVLALVREAQGGGGEKSSENP
jgi:hypothetical protein